MKLRRKVIQGIVIANILPLMLIVGWVYSESSNQVVSRAISEMTSQHEDVANVLKLRIKTAIRDVQLLRRSDIVKKYLLLEDEEVKYQIFYQSVADQLMQYLFTNDNYSEARLINHSGYEEVRVVRGNTRNIVEDNKELAWFKAVSDNIDTADIIISDHKDFSEKSILVISHPTSKGGKIRPGHNAAYVVISILSSTFTQYLNSKSIGESGFYVLRLKDGTLLWPSMKADDVVQKLLPSSPHVLENNYYLSDIEIENIGTLHALWPKSEINSELELLLFAIVIMSLMALFITGGLTFVVLSKFVLTPMGLVKDQLDNIGTNEFIIPELRSYKDEIGELAVGMQKASQALVEKNNALEMIAYHDELTGLANRHRFFDCLSSYMAYSDRHHAKLTLLFLDLDGFKEVNDTSGHEAGDHVLKEVAERLQRCVRDEDFVTPILGQDKADSLSRLGGDEFTVLLFGLKNNRDAGIVASRLIAVLNEAFTVDEQIFHLGASIGIAHYPDDGNDTSSLLKNADTAMYASKEHGKNMYSYYKASMSEVALLKHRLSNDLRVDLKKELLCLYYQPQVDAESGDVKGLEALIRWPHAELGMIPPPQLIEVAEECGLILPVGDWVLRQACKDLAKLKSNGILDLTMSINVSAIQLMSGGFELQVIQALKDYGINGPELMLEITETTLIQNIDEISSVMNTLKDKGVRFSLDDFGTGYSSLASLQALNIDELKIDKSFIDRVSEDENGRAIVRALLAMTHQLHIGTVAEGVEKEEQKLFLIEQECELLQGYLFSRPLPFAELVLYLQSKK